MVAVGVIVVVVIAMALLIKNCEGSAAQNALKNYNADVYRLITASDNNGAEMFSNRVLASGELTSNITKLGDQLDSAAGTARTQLTKAESFSAPSQMSSAQTSLVEVMRLRERGIARIAANIQSAANKSTSKDAIYNISVGTSMLYASDVLYKTFVAPDIAKALNAAGIPIGSGAGEQQINGGQIVPDLGWLQSTYIAEKTGAQLSTAAANQNNAGPGLHGHSLNSVTVDGTQLSPTATNTIPASARTFTLSLTNGGTTNELDVECKVSVKGLSDVGTSTIAETTPGETTSCNVTLPSAPTPGTYSVTAEIVPVPGEKNTSNNSATYTVTFN